MPENSDQTFTKTVLLVKSQPRGMIALEMFLRSRGWIVNSTTNPKEALKILVGQQPTFVLVSMDHPQKSVRGLPNILLQTFAAQVFVFSDTGRSNAFKGIKDSPKLHRLHPPLTGTSVEQALNAVFAAEKEKIEIQTGTAQIYRGNKNQKNEWNQEEPEDSMTLISKLAQELQDEEAQKIATPPAKPQGPQTKNFQSSEKPKPKESRFAMPPQEKKEGDALSSGDGKKKSSQMAYQPDQQEKAAQGPAVYRPDLKEKNTVSVEAIVPEAKARQKGGFETPEESANSADGNALDFRQRKGPTGPSGYQPDQVDKKVPPSQRQSLAPEAARTQRASEPQRPGPETPDEAKDLPLAGPEEIRDAMEVAFDRGDGHVDEKLVVTSKLNCMAMNTLNSSGYLVVAIAEDREMDEELIASISNYLIQRMGKALDGTEWTTVNVQGVNFVEWAETEADFCHQSVHKGSEVAVAFFPNEKAQLQITDSPSEEMAAIELDQLRPDSELQFDMSIYLPANKKFIFYIARGATFVKVQYDRLKRMGLTHIHVSKSQLREVKSYRAGLVLSDQISSFQGRKESIVS